MIEIIIHYAVGFLIIVLIVVSGMYYLDKFHGRRIVGEPGVSLHGTALHSDLKKYLGDKASKDPKSNLSIGKP